MLVAVSAVAAAVFCFAAGSAVLTRGRVISALMAIAMVILVLHRDPAVLLVVAAALVGSALFATAGRRGRADVLSDTHRALASIVMALLTLGMLGSSPAAGDHGSHGLAEGAVGWIASAGALGVIVWLMVSYQPKRLASLRRGGRAAQWAALEALAMTLSVVLMWIDAW